MIELEVSFKAGKDSTLSLHREITIDDLNRIMLDRSPFKILLTDYINPLLDEYGVDIVEYDYRFIEKDEGFFGKGKINLS